MRVETTISFNRVSLPYTLYGKRFRNLHSQLRYILYNVHVLWHRIHWNITATMFLNCTVTNCERNCGAQ